MWSMVTSRLDRVVIESVTADLQSSSFVAAAVKATREKFALTHTDDIAAAHAEFAKIDSQISRLLAMASQLASPGGFEPPYSP